MLDVAQKNQTANREGVAVFTYANLLERKIVVPSASSQYLAIDQHFFFDLFAYVLSYVYFDENWYLTRYQDIQKALERGIVTSARQHYMRFGFYEHRLPYRIEIDEAWYLKTYSDVKNAIEKRQYASGQVHFEVAGFGEGRLPYPNFTLRMAEQGGLKS